MVLFFMFVGEFFTMFLNVNHVPFHIIFYIIIRELGLIKTLKQELNI